MSNQILPDLHQCQAFIDVPKHSSFLFNPDGGLERCQNKPVWILVRTRDDKKLLSICHHCSSAMLQHCSEQIDLVTMGMYLQPLGEIEE
jgi:hypothetical protein